jgi:hypothetical protein
MNFRGAVMAFLCDHLSTLEGLYLILGGVFAQSANVAVGSISDLRACASDVSFAPVNGHRHPGGWLIPWATLAQYLAGLPVDKVQLGAGEAGDHLIFVCGHVWIVVQRMLDIHQCRRAGENNRRHRQNMTAKRR